MMIIIPARIASSRFPKKVLADIHGLPMVIKTAKAVESIDSVVIATDSQEVIDIASKYGIKAILTSPTHQSGTDRIAEAVEALKLDENEIIINVQGDEPFIEKEVVEAVYKLTKRNRDNPTIMMNSCYKIVSNEEANESNLVKVVTDKNEFALYFSRSKIPFSRDGILGEYKAHLGIYGFSVKSLKAFCLLESAPLEEIEKLEQLRVLYSGNFIAMTKVVTQSFGIDTPEDLQKALRYHQD